MAVFLAMAGLAIQAGSSPKTDTIEIRGVLGGPAPSMAVVGVGIAQGAELVDSPVFMQTSALMVAPAMPAITDPTAAVADLTLATIQDPGQPVGQVFSPSGIITYTIKRGDNLSQIAARFNVSVTNIISANPNLNKKIIPVGATITIPDGVRAVQVADQNAKLANFNKNFTLPAQGYNYGILHNNNAVDIANSCGTSVVASAEGLVIPDKDIPDVVGAWNGGYGNFILIEHPFGDGVYTRYAHLQKMLVEPGDYVKQGQQIGLMGESGEATGCHIHFEVLGAQNPFAK